MLRISVALATSPLQKRTVLDPVVEDSLVGGMLPPQLQMIITVRTESGPVGAHEPVANPRWGVQALRTWCLEHLIVEGFVMELRGTRMCV